MSVEKYEQMNRERAISTTIDKTKKVKRVAAYCRVSTDSEEQESSLENQQQYFEELINEHPNWVLYKIFSDEGKSGTNTKNRPAFNHMIECAKNGEIDLILTKEISRFARNVVDCLQYTHELLQLGVEVRFITQGISTFTPGYDLAFTFHSAFAQNESKTTSDRVKFGQYRQMQKGVVFGRSMLGYDVHNGQMTINEEGAEIVRLIFHKFVDEGKGTHVIAKELYNSGIHPMQVKEWSNTVILRVIRNEKYCGDLVQRKTYTPDYLTHKKKYNRGEEEYIIIKDHHEPIISREMFDEANRILDERSQSQKGKSKHSNRYPYSGKLKCGICGNTYVSRYKERQDGSQYKTWRCGESVKNGNPHIDIEGNQVGCYCNSIRDEDVTHIMYLTFKSLNINRKRVQNNLLKTIKRVISENSNDSPIGKLNKELQKETEKRERLIDIFTEGSITKEEFYERKAKLDTVINEISNNIESIQNGKTMQKKQDELFSDIAKNIDELLDGVEYSDQFYREILDKMVIIGKDTIDVYLKFLPEKWCYIVSSAVNTNNTIYNGSITDTEVPISVSSPIPILSGIVNL